LQISSSYDAWSEQYDKNINKTRDLEAAAIRKMLQDYSFRKVLEIGCGTGKNTEWLSLRAEHIIAVDFSEKMLAKAKQKISGKKVDFILADIEKPWHFNEKKFDLVTCSLVLEHIENPDPLFERISAALPAGGIFYLGELHPFRQYLGSQARFDTVDGRHFVTCYVHHVSEFTSIAKKCSLQIKQLTEFFDDDDEIKKVPRILSIVFEKV
jgi:ubiquinone/menaquinone biosynthesis C-methylase UbiE